LFPRDQTRQADIHGDTSLPYQYTIPGDGNGNAEDVGVFVSVVSKNASPVSTRWSASKRYINAPCAETSQPGRYREARHQSQLLHFFESSEPAKTLCAAFIPTTR
jgi:hypothetical protein